MSHFTVTIFQNPNQHFTIEDILNPYDENLEIPYIITKQEHINNSKKSIREYKNTIYKKYLDNPKEYVDKCFNKYHIKYLQEEFPLKLKWTDEEHYQKIIEYYNQDQINKDGSTNEIYNPNSKWDWYTIGGRWDGLIKTKTNKQVNTAILKNINIENSGFPTYAYILNGKWVEKREMGWFDMSDVKYIEEKEWKTHFIQTLKSLPQDTIVTIIDCHI